MTIVFTFLFTTALYGFLAWWATRRIVKHMQDNPEAVKAISEHILIPLFKKKE